MHAALLPPLSFHKSVESQPQSAFFPSEVLRQAVCGGLFLVGQLFVLSSFWRLGVTGTFLGDYCGIFMNERVTGFPFNVLDNPMYVGSTMSFLAYSLWYGSWAGLLITAEVAIVYHIALKFEGPYTTQIYIERDQARKANKKTQ
jgi:methylene-fatty-acyl-phospholipid synthase